MAVTAEQARKLLSYDSETGVFTWTNPADPQFLGRCAGAQTKAPVYSQICINGKSYLAHRLAWLMVTGKWPTGLIDHINGDSRDNRFVNLRQATHRQNLQNRKISKNNSTGLKGVVPTRGKFRAKIVVHGTHIHLGHFATKEAAHAAYVAAAEKHFGAFARAA